MGALRAPATRAHRSRCGLPLMAARAAPEKLGRRVHVLRGKARAAALRGHVLHVLEMEPGSRPPPARYRAHRAPCARGDVRGSGLPLVALGATPPKVDGAALVALRETLTSAAPRERLHALEVARWRGIATRAPAALLDPVGARSELVTEMAAPAQRSIHPPDAPRQQLAPLPLRELANVIDRLVFAPAMRAPRALLHVIRCCLPYVKPSNSLRPGPLACARPRSTSLRVRPLTTRMT